MEEPAALIPIVSRELEPAGIRLVEAFLSGRSPRTAQAYRQDLKIFCSFLGVQTTNEAARELVSRSHGEANSLVLAYRAELLEKGLSPATVNRRLAAVRSLVKLARTLGLVAWELEVPSVKTRAYRDTRGPGRSGVRRLLDELEKGESRHPKKAARDRAALRLLYDVALRRGEVVSLDVEDVDLEASTVAVLGKGRTERELVSIPEPTKAALRAWLELRGTEPGPLFVNFDRAGKGRRLTGTSLYRLVRSLGQAAGVKARPHGLRHAAITEALEVTNGNVRTVQRFSRHADPRTVALYDDAREDLAGEVARLVAAGA